MSLPPEIEAKIKRADEHFRDIERQISEWVQSNPYAYIRETDPQSGDQLLRFHLQRPIPRDKWSPIIGDCLHNLRSALDHLVCALVVANRRKIYSGHQFPIYDSAAEYNKRSPGCVQGARKQAIKLIDSLKPYKGGNDALWLLHALNINDKHRGLIAVASSQGAVIIDFSKHWKAAGLRELPDTDWMKLGIRPATPCPLEDGDVLYRIPRNEIGKGDDNPEMTCAPAFYEPGLIECEPITPTLSQLASLVDQTINQFGSFFPLGFAIHATAPRAPRTEGLSARLFNSGSTGSPGDAS